MNPKVSGYFLMAAGIVSAMMSVRLAMADFSDLDGMPRLFFECLTAGTFAGTFMLIFCGRKFAAIGPEHTSGDTDSRQYLLSCLLLYASACMLGACTIPFFTSAIGLSGAEEFAHAIAASGYMRYIEILAVAGLLGTFVLRSTMRDPDVVEAMMWYKYRMGRATSLWRILVAMVPPLCVLPIIIMVVGFVVSNHSADIWFCMYCHVDNGGYNNGGSRCKICGRKRGALSGDVFHSERLRPGRCAEIR